MIPAISIDGVHKHYGSLHAVQGISFDVQQGEFFGLLGPNGAGKSTLINIMAGLVRASSGHISVLGHDVVSAYRQSRQSIGIVPQELVYDPFFNVREMLRLQAGYFGLGKKADDWIDELLAALSLTDKAQVNLHDLSGGMKRRVLIAQAMVHKPQVLVLDEPTAGVDVELRQSLWRFVEKLNQEGVTILLTTHYLEEAEALCDRIAVVNKGSLSALDSKQALLQQHPFRLLHLTLTGQNVMLPEQVQQRVISVAENQVTLRLHRQDDSISGILQALHDAGVDVNDLSTEQPGLEEVFIGLVNDQEPSS